MARHIDPRIYNNFVDANFWDRSGDQREDEAMRDILELFKRCEINLILPFSVKAEIGRPNTPPEIKRLAAGMTYTLQTHLTPDEQTTRAQLMALIQGNAKAGQHDWDVHHLFEADKYGGGYFITKDGRLLKKSVEVERLLGSLCIVSPSTFMSHVSSDGA